MFAWCEAFFFIAHTSPDNGWPQVDIITELFNPWYDWRHRDWCETSGENASLLSDEVARLLAPVYPDPQPWLAFWFPLRRGDHAQDEFGHVPLIVGDSPDRLPGETPSRFHTKICDELGLLTPSLVCLRSLREIRIVNSDMQTVPTLIWEFPLSSERIPERDCPAGVVHVAGQTDLRRPDTRPTTNHYCGVAGRLADDTVDHIKHKPGWPQVVGRIRDQSDAGYWAKGEPHFGTMISYRSHRAARTSETLEIRWCVFFPVAKQPADSTPISLPGIPHQIIINLHGFFFLDSERVRIDGLEDRFTHNGSTGNPSCLEWNRIVATQGTLAQLPRALAAFAQQESLHTLQCHELANAFQTTWTWKGFHKEICQLETWRPCWRSGTETWERVPASKRVLPLPDVSHASELLACVPDLGPISETEILTACQSINSMPGLHNARIDSWAEDLVLQLLSHTRLDDAANNEEAGWINRFLNQLCELNPLSQAVLAQASSLPLLWVSDVRSKSPRRISAREWTEAHSRHGLFAADPTTDSWVAMLSAALPTWSCFVAEARRLPRWFSARTPPTCTAGQAAEIILRQSQLAGFAERVTLINAFASSVGRDSRHRLAMRFLLHGDTENANDEFETLFLPSPIAGQHVWSRLIEQLRQNSGEIEPWQLLHRDWATVLNIDLQSELHISTIDASGVSKELSKGHVNLDALEFPQEQWDANDISTLLQGLFQAGHTTPDITAAILRRLRVHTLRNRPEHRVSVADETGDLGELFVLDKPGFDSRLPPNLHSLWQNFLAETKVVERLPDTDLASIVQNNVFKRRQDDGTETSAELCWNYVVRRCLESAEPSKWAPLILQGFAAQGDTAAAGLGKKLRATKWIPLGLGGAIAPESILNIEGIEADLHRLLDPGIDGIAGVLALAEWVREHDGFPTLRKNLPRRGDALELLELWLRERTDWHLGLTDPSTPGDLEAILAELEEVDQVPVAALLAKFCRLQFAKIAA